MIYAQVSRGQRMHLALEAGEELPNGEVIRRGQLSLPLCGRRFDGGYRMTCNMGLASVCSNCNRVYRARYGVES